MATTYPVKVYFFCYGFKRNRIYCKDRNDAYNKAWSHGEKHNLEVVEVYYLEFPRTLNAEIAIMMMTGEGLDKVTPQLHEKVYTSHYYARFKFEREQKKEEPKKEEPPKKEQPKPSSDPYIVLGLKSSMITREDLNAAYRAAAMKHHPDLGGDLAMMQAVNQAKATIMKRMGWR